MLKEKIVLTGKGKNLSITFIKEQQGIFYRMGGIVLHVGTTTMASAVGQRAWTQL